MTIIDSTFARLALASTIAALSACGGGSSTAAGGGL